MGFTGIDLWTSGQGATLEILNRRFNKFDDEEVTAAA